MRTIKFCSVVFSITLRLRHKNVVVRLPQTTNDAPYCYQGWVPTCHGPAPLGGRTVDNTRWSQILAIFAYSTCIRIEAPLGSSTSEYCYNVWHGKLEWCGYPTVKNSEAMFIRFDRHERDRQTDGRTASYSEEGSGRGAAPPSPLLAVPIVTAHPSTASLPTSYYSKWHYNYLCILKPVLHWREQFARIIRVSVKRA